MTDDLSDPNNWPPYGSLLAMTRKEQIAYNLACDDAINQLLEYTGEQYQELAGIRGTFADHQCCMCSWLSPFAK